MATGKKHLLQKLVFYEYNIINKIVTLNMEKGWGGGLFPGQHYKAAEEFPCIP